MWYQSEQNICLRGEGADLLTFCLDRSEAKTFLHPVRAPGQETILTDCYPDDHIWHRGVWWSWKYINDLNYWEESDDHVSDGLTRLDNVEHQISATDARIQLDLTYLPPKGSPVLSEHRVINASAPNGGVTVVDFHYSFTALEDAVLRATSVTGEPNERWFGGYAGFSVRRSAETKQWAHRDSMGREGDANIHGQTARWVTAGGSVPEGEASLTILSYPKNPRAPEKWYAYGEMLPYFSPAILFGGALVLKKGDTFECRYQLLIADRMLKDEEIESHYEAFTSTLKEESE